MKKQMLMGGLAAVLLVAAALATGSASAGSDQYKFTVRGNVTAVDRSAKTITIYATHTSAKASEDLAGNTTEFNVASTKFYKYNAAGKKVRTTIGNVPVGNEVVIKGAKKSNGQFNVSELTVNSNTFSMVGTLKAYDTNNKIATVEVSYIDYKSNSFKGKKVLVYYGANTTFRNQNNIEINSDEVNNDSEKVKITGTVGNASKFEALTFIDGYTKSK